MLLAGVPSERACNPTAGTIQHQRMERRILLPSLRPPNPAPRFTPAFDVRLRCPMFISSIDPAFPPPILATNEIPARPSISAFLGKGGITAMF